MSLAMVSTTVLALVLLTLAGYAHLRLGAHTAGAGRAATTRLVLIVVGIGVGLVGARLYSDDYPLAVMAFLAGLGLAHVPAAVILFVKTRRGEGKS